MRQPESINSFPVIIETRNGKIEGLLAIPIDSQHIIIFANTGGYSRFNTRNQQITAALNDASLATLLCDLLTQDEYETDQTADAYQLDIDFLSNRLIDCVDWVSSYPATEDLSIGLLSANTGSAAAMRTAVARPHLIHSIVCRSGRPDLATAETLKRVQSPTQLIIGEFDSVILELNREAANQLNIVHEIKVVNGATHFFEEPGKLNEFANLAKNWFKLKMPMAYV